MVHVANLPLDVNIFDMTIMATSVPFASGETIECTRGFNSACAVASITRGRHRIVLEHQLVAHVIHSTAVERLGEIGNQRPRYVCCALG